MTRLTSALTKAVAARDCPRQDLQPEDRAQFNCGSLAESRTRATACLLHDFEVQVGHNAKWQG